MKDFLIIYEVKRRELENAFLLKVRLEKMGYTCDVANFYDSEYFSLFGRQKYRTIIVPQLYFSESILRVVSRFGPCDRIFNLQCKQILSDDFEEADLHTPKNEARNAVHACWGPRTHKKLAASGIEKDRLPMVGNLSLDFCIERIISKITPTREELAQKYGLDPKKKWVLFTSSFTFADMPEDRRKMDERLLGISLSSRIELFSKSRVDMLAWFSDLVQNQDIVFIYRPHPDEFNLAVVEDLVNRYPNFKMISDLNVRAWTYICDSILNWYSTSCIEAFFLEKPYFVLRPYPIPSDIELTVMKKVKKIQSSAELLKTNLFEINNEFHDKESLEQFYHFDRSKPSILKYVDELIRMTKSNVRHEFDLSLKGRIKSIMKTWLLFCLHKYYLWFMGGEYKPASDGSGNFLTMWLRAFHYNVAKKAERDQALKLASQIYDLERAQGR